MNTRNKPLAEKGFEAAIALCRRLQGATTDDLSDVMLGRASFDCPQVLRYYLRRYKPALKLVSRKVPHVKRGWRQKLHGNCLTYFIQEGSEVS